MKKPIKIVGALLFGMAVLLVSFLFSTATAYADDTVVRWDIVSG